ncbi:N-acetylmuramidase family protein, partial [Porphyromonadaceae bacterium OttesenSCG-928-L07]|nr:N-acetylmuramidase family protein [Porphyromonadaceae bacterium OttesenSCG-928-L07]
VDGNEDILHPKWSKIHYKGGIQEYERLEKAKMIHEEAALASASWGMFQIMGFDFALCGEKSVREMVDRMTESEACQLKLFLIFLEKNKWVNYLRNKDWARFARCYNGPGYAINQYDRKLQMAYEKYSKKSVC